MKSMFRHTTALVLAAGLAGFAAAGSAAADEEFNGCTEPHWNAFSDAVTAGTTDELESFIELIGSDCAPLLQTAEVLICDADPAYCLQEIEPAAGTPVEEIPEEPQEIEDPRDDFAYRAPGEHLGWENDPSGARNDASPSTSQPSQPSGRDDYSPPSESISTSISTF